MVFMTDNWDFYSCRVDNKAASIYVDLGAIEMAPVASLPFIAYVRIAMNAPREDGLSSNGEFDVLMVIEDSLKQALADERTAYIGRCTTNGCRDFFFYTAETDAWEYRVAMFRVFNK